jgi:branched-chain amino acid transport system ATP-binding protein
MPFLQVERLIKSFGGLMALCEVNFEIFEGEIFGVIGPNGSGKTTLFNVITGFLKANKGKVTFMGKDITGLPPHQICRQGIARIFQLVKPFHQLTTFQNVMVGRYRKILRPVESEEEWLKFSTTLAGIRVRSLPLNLRC